MKKLLIATALSIWASVAQATPSVTGGSGTVGDGNSFTVTGSGFGSKISPVDGSPKPWLLYDFEAGSLNSNSTFSTGGSVAIGVQNMSVVAEARGLSTRMLKADALNWTQFANGGIVTAYMTMPAVGRGGRIFKFQQRKSSINNYSHANGAVTSFENWKFDRIFVDPAAGNYPNHYYAQLADSGLCNGNGGGARSFVETAGDGSYPSMRFPGTTWMEETYELKFNSINAAHDGILKLWQDGAINDDQTAWSQDFSGTSSADLRKWYTQDDPSNLTFCGGSETRHDVWYDDIVYDYGPQAFARVVIINTNSLASATVVEYQVATVWASGSITFTQRHGNLGSGSKWVVVFDSNDVPSTPFLIQTSAGGGNPAPTVTGLSPTAISTIGGSTITANGTGFLPGVVGKIGTTSCTTTLVSPTQIKILAPVLSAGTYSFTALNTDTQNAVVASTIVVTAPPVVTTFTPTTAYAIGGNRIMLGGSNLGSITSVSVSGTAGTSISVITSTAVAFTMPAKSAGSYSITATASDGQSVTSTGTITVYAAPAITSVVPNAVPTGGAAGVKIFGTGFRSGMTLNVAGTACTSVSVITSTAATCTVPAKSAATYTMTAVNDDTQSGSLSSAITYNSAPTVIACSPPSADINGLVSVTLTGANFSATINSVKFGGTNATSVVRVSATSITCVVPAHALGVVSIVVENSDTQTGTFTNGFEYVAVTPAFVNPADDGSVCPCQ